MRLLFFAGGDALLLILSITGAAWLRFDGQIPSNIVTQLPLAAMISVAVKLSVFAAFRLYAVSWSQVSLEDMVAVFRGATLGSGIFWLIVLILRWTGELAGFPRAILLIDYIVTLNAVGAFRMGRRVYQHLICRAAFDGRPAVIFGAGEAGEQLARSLRQALSSGYTPLGFVDDDPRKIGTVIHGLRVLGDRARLPAIIRRHKVEAVLIAMPSAPSRLIRNIVSLAREGGAREIRIVPGLDRLLNGQLSFTDLREVQLADLLSREVVQIDPAGVEDWLRNRTVLVTGAGGSIGSELCIQIARFGPKTLVLLDYDESGVFWIEQELRRLKYQALAVIADVRDPIRIREVFSQIKPHVVFHAAAYKHVGLMERHLEEAVSTNVLGTLVVAQASLKAGVEKFVLISTDKAVNPTSVMGVSKRVAEQVCVALNQPGTTGYLAVRFGNVLGSRGSVIPLFRERIRRGEPLIVRGPNMRRYFMATSEAVMLVLQAAAIGRGGEIFALDMGDPVRILDLAHELVRLSGLEPEKDVPIVLAEPEPGEKEHEDLLTAEEGAMATRYDRIFISRDAAVPHPEMLFTHVDELEKGLRTRDRHRIIRTLQLLVPRYQPSELILSLAVDASPHLL